MPPATVLQKVRQMRLDRKLPRQGNSGKGELLASDVGPVPRQCLTRIDDFFYSTGNLTLFDELVRGQVPELAVRAG